MSELPQVIYVNEINHRHKASFRNGNWCDTDKFKYEAKYFSGDKVDQLISETCEREREEIIKQCLEIYFDEYEDIVRGSDSSVAKRIKALLNAPAPEGE